MPVGLNRAVKSCVCGRVGLARRIQRSPQAMLLTVHHSGLSGAHPPCSLSQGVCLSVRPALSTAVPIKHITNKNAPTITMAKRPFTDQPKRV